MTSTVASKAEATQTSVLEFPSGTTLTTYSDSSILYRYPGGRIHHKSASVAEKEEARRKIEIEKANAQYELWKATQLDAIKKKFRMSDDIAMTEKILSKGYL
jgi:hypothetical protein